MKIITLVIFLSILNLTFSQDNRKMLDFYKDFYELNFSREDSVQNQKFNNLFENNLFEDEFKLAVYAVFINKQIGNEQDLNLRTMMLLNLMKRDQKLEMPIYKMKGSELHGVFNETLSKTKLDVSKLFLFENEIEKQNQKDKIFFKKSYFQEVQFYIEKYSPQKK